jgi:hypothetical protein
MTAVLEAGTVRRRSVLGLPPGPAVASAAAVLAVVGLLSGLSYPGFPVDAAACAVLAATTAVAVAVGLGVRARATGRGRLRAVVVLGVVTGVLAAGVLAARADDGQRLQARWASSRAAFEHEVSSAGAPVRSETSDSFAPYPGACPVRIGELGIAACRSVDGGYLFLQSQGALTDDSGIVYLPEATRPTSSWWSTETMTPLGGPWWSWTCGC